MISGHQISNFGENVRQMILGAEGFNSQPTNVGDHTVTYGYGYTFIRRGEDNVWGIPTFIENDLASIGITLTQTELDRLGTIVEALNASNFTLADERIAQFELGWQHNPLNSTNAQALFNVENWA